jgi:hypothetical protein
MRRLILLLVLVLAVPLSASEMAVKSLSGPPEEFLGMRLPSANALAVASNLLVLDPPRGAQLPVGVRAVPPPTFETSPGVGFSVVQTTTVYPFFSPVTVASPTGVVYAFDGYSLSCNGWTCGEYQAEVSLEPLGETGGGVMSLSVSGGEVTGGSWAVTVQESLPYSAAQVETMVAFDDNVVEVWIDPCLEGGRCECPPDQICPIAAAPGLEWVEGRQVALSVGFAKGSGQNAALRTAPLLQELRAYVQEERSGRLVHAETLSAARAAALPTDRQGFPVFRLPALPAGLYSVRLDVTAEVPGLGRIARTGFYTLPIHERRFELRESATTAVLDADRLRIDVALDGQAESQKHVYAYGELWSRDSEKPIAWVGGMTHPRGTAGELTLPLVFDARWLAIQKVEGRELWLRNLRVQDAETFAVLDQVNEIPLSIATLPDKALLLGAALELDETLYVGKGDITIPATVAAPPVANKSGTPSGILLVHGWCSARIWPEWEFWRGPTVEFNDTNASRSHDTFAQLIRAQGDAAFPDWFSIVAHSQGGAAATHLLAFYWSRLDNSIAPRRIQSLGTPYWGSTLMDLYTGLGPTGLLLAAIFGSCLPQQFNMTTPGSALWQATIPSHVRSQVHYYRTRHTRPSNFWQRLQFWRWRCNAASFVIPGADDGVVADWQGGFGGANDHGIVDGQCHTGGMNHMSQLTDGGRNATMDQLGRSFTGNLSLAAFASASSTFCSGSGEHCYSPARTNDGNRSTALGGFTSWSNDRVSLPQWLQHSWPVPITVSRVEVFTSSGYPVADYDIEWWTGSSWVVAASVRGNTSLQRSHTFAPVTTTALRVLGLRGPSHQPGYVRVNELEVCR